jgi:MazG family protein
MSKLSPALEFTRLVDIVAALRAPDGCPWDREQTIDSLKPFVLEETYEVLEAIDRHDHDALREELGDFLFEAVFLAQLEAEAGLFTIADSIRAIADKLVRRHPHVFARDAGEPPRSTGRVRCAGEEMGSEGAREITKQTHRRHPRPVLPARPRSACARRRSASTGTPRRCAPQDRGEGELREVVGTGGRSTGRAEEEMGDLLFSIANLSRAASGETALRKPTRSCAPFRSHGRHVADSSRVAHPG